MKIELYLVSLVYFYWKFSLKIVMLLLKLKLAFDELEQKDRRDRLKILQCNITTYKS